MTNSPEDRSHRRGLRTQEGKTEGRGVFILAPGYRLLAPLFVLLTWATACRAQSVDGFAALRAGDYAAAESQFEAALRSRPDHDASRSGLLQVLRETGRYRDALERAKTFGSSPAVSLERGRSAAAVGDWAVAESELRRVFDAGGERRFDAARELALVLEQTGRRSQALPIWQQLVDAYRRGTVRGSQALGNVAVAAWHLGYFKDANDIFVDATSGEGVALESLENFGYLFLEKYDATDAIGVFRDCLKINKSYAPALLGLALAKKYESSDEAAEFARAALKVNASYVAAMQLLAELHIQEEDYAEGLEQIERALAVHPSDLASLTLKAVYHALRGESAPLGDMERKVLGLDPAYGRLYHAVAENLVTRRKYREAVEADRKAIALDPRLWAAHCSLGMNLMRIGEVAEGRRAIEKAFEGDPFNVWAFNTLDLLDQMAKFVEARSEHFVVRMAKEDEPALGPLAPRLAEEVYSALTRKYGFTPPRAPITIEIFPDHGGFAVRTLGLPGLGALGVCFGNVIALDSPRARKSGEFNWGSTLWHEFAHVITLEMSRHNVPRWFSEGVSVYEERRARPGWGDDLNARIVKAYKEGKLLKVSELNAGMMRPKNPEQIALSYYQASLVCEMIEEKFGFAKIREVLQLWADELSTEQVFRRALGWDTSRMDAEYARFLEGRLARVAQHLDFKRLEEVHGAETQKEVLEGLLARDPDDFFANLQLGLLHHKAGDAAAAERHLAKAASIFPEFVEGGNPYQPLAEIYLASNRPAEALAALESWVMRDENAIAPLRRAAEIHRNRKDWTGVTRVLSQAVFIDPYQADVFSELGHAAAEAGDWGAAAAAYKVLVGLDPADPASAHYELARALAGSGKRQEAKRAVLRSLEIAPTFEKAQALLLKLSAGQP